MNLNKDEIIRRIESVLRRYRGVLFGYLFGSVAEGFEREDSDVDVAIYLDEKLSDEESFKLELEIGAELESNLKRKVDLIPLNRAHPLLAFKAIQGEVAMERDPVKRSLIASKIMSRYYDFRHFFKFCKREMARRARGARCRLE